MVMLIRISSDSKDTQLTACQTRVLLVKAAEQNLLPQYKFKLGILPSVFRLTDLCAALLSVFMLRAKSDDEQQYHRRVQTLQWEMMI